MTTTTRLPVDTAFVQLLRDNTTKPVYFPDSGTAESGVPPTDTTPPYVMVTPIPGGETVGPPLATPEADVEVYYQTDCVGGTASQAVWMADEVRKIVVGRNATGTFDYPLTITGFDVLTRYTDGGMAGAALDGKLWVSRPRWCIFVTPA